MFALSKLLSFKEKCGRVGTKIASKVFSFEALKPLGFCGLGFLTLLMVLEKIGFIQDPMWTQHVLAVMVLCVYLALMVFAIETFTKRWSIAFLSTGFFCVAVLWEAMV